MYKTQNPCFNPHEVGDDVHLAAGVKDRSRYGDLPVIFVPTQYNGINATQIRQKIMSVDIKEFTYWCVDVYQRPAEQAFEWLWHRVRGHYE